MSHLISVVMTPSALGMVVDFMGVHHVCIQLHKTMDHHKTLSPTCRHMEERGGMEQSYLYCTIEDSLLEFHIKWDRIGQTVPAAGRWNCYSSLMSSRNQYHPNTTAVTIVLPHATAWTYVRAIKVLWRSMQDNYYNQDKGWSVKA